MGPLRPTGDVVQRRPGTSHGYRRRVDRPADRHPEPATLTRRGDGSGRTGGPTRPGVCGHGGLRPGPDRGRHMHSRTPLSQHRRHDPGPDRRYRLGRLRPERGLLRIRLRNVGGGRADPGGLRRKGPPHRRRETPLRHGLPRPQHQHPVRRRGRRRRVRIIRGRCGRAGCGPRCRRWQGSHDGHQVHGLARRAVAHQRPRDVRAALRGSGRVQDGGAEHLGVSGPGPGTRWPHRRRCGPRGPPSGQRPDHRIGHPTPGNRGGSGVHEHRRVGQDGSGLDPDGHQRCTRRRAGATGRHDRPDSLRRWRHMGFDSPQMGRQDPAGRGARG